MKIKEKVIEVKEETVKFFKKNGPEILIGISMFSAGIGGYLIGEVFGKKSYRDYLLNEFGIDSVDDDNTVVYRDTKTGLIDAIVTEEFDKLLHENADLITHDDGTWDFKSEVE